MRKQIFIIAICFLLWGCIEGGTLGGFDKRIFSTSKNKLNKAIDTLYLNHSEYKIPDKWSDRDNWSERGYGFLESRIFYFKAHPEEMYYVSFIGDSATLADSKEISIAIRAIYNGGKNWKPKNDLDKHERERIEVRFDKEIIYRLESYTKVKAQREH